MIPLPFLARDPQDLSPQYLIDLAAGYWFSEVLFTAVELGIFTLIDRKGKTADEISRELDIDPKGMDRFLSALCSLGLLNSYDSYYYNTRLSSDYLVSGKSDYQGNLILWHKYISHSWQGLARCLKSGGRVEFDTSDCDPDSLSKRIRKYISAMDCVARTKVPEILNLFEGTSLKGEILDVGAGSGAISAGFLEHFPFMKTTLLDLPEVIDFALELMAERGLEKRVSCCKANVLEDWPVRRGSFDIVILSNIVHAYSEKEIPLLLLKASECLKPDGFLLIHDFFLEHHPEKASLFDLNMFINTYNGKVFSNKWILGELSRLKLCRTNMIPLQKDTAVIIASKDEKRLSQLALDPLQRLLPRILELGFSKVNAVDVKDIYVSDWTDLRCRFGCDSYGKPNCPPNSPSPQKTKDILKDYSRAILIEGEPPTQSFQLKVLKAEGEAFKSGFHKAFAYWAGPCSICDNCTVDIEGICTNTANARPSMEGSGIDVFETVRKSGTSLRTLRDKNDFVKYFGLLLLE